MEGSVTTATLPSPDRLIRPFETSRLAPAWLGIGFAILWVVVVALVHTGANAMIGQTVYPSGATRFSWTVVVDAVLLALLLAGHAHLYMSAASDLQRLRPLLPEDDTDFELLTRNVVNLSAPIRIAVTIAGVVGGIAAATLDPVLRDLHRDLARTDPRYLIFILQNILIGTLGVRLFAAEIHMTRAFSRLGDRVQIDLFDQSLLLVFARKGLRTVVLWVLISSVMSMFWLLDSAGQLNTGISILVLALVIVALIAPTRSVHLRIVAAKAAELALVSEAIRTERAATLAPRRPDAPPEDARLGNLIQYQKFIESVREWPFDISIVARSVLLVILGAGSWLGGAVVERMLGLALD